MAFNFLPFKTERNLTQFRMVLEESFTSSLHSTQYYFLWVNGNRQGIQQFPAVTEKAQQQQLLFALIVFKVSHFPIGGREAGERERLRKHSFPNVQCNGFCSAVIHISTICFYQRDTYRKREDVNYRRQMQNACQKCLYLVMESPLNACQQVKQKSRLSIKVWKPFKRWDTSFDLLQNANNICVPMFSHYYCHYCSQFARNFSRLDL